MGIDLPIQVKSITIEADLDYPLADAANKEELDFMIDHLQATDLMDSARSAPTFLYHVKVLPKGWESLQTNTNRGISGRCFVAMSFDAALKALNDAYNSAIEPALRSCGLDPRRVDRILDNRDINEKIIAELREAEFVVADFTGQRNGVYFEAGFARGLGREVFWCCRKDEMKDLHFDTRQFSFIVWSSLDELKEGLIDKIKALGFARS